MSCGVSSSLRGWNVMAASAPGSRNIPPDAIVGFLADFPLSKMITFDPGYFLQLISISPRSVDFPAPVCPPMNVCPTLLTCRFRKNGILKSVSHTTRGQEFPVTLCMNGFEERPSQMLLIGMTWLVLFVETKSSLLLQ